MLWGWSVGIADFPSQVGSETTHAASTSGQIGKGRRRSSAPGTALADRRVCDLFTGATSAHSSVEGRKIPNTKRSCT